MTAQVSLTKQVSDENKHSEECQNCGAHLLGEYCHKCGQSAENHIHSVKDFFVHVISDLLHFDSKIFRSITPLLVKPGILTRDFLKGKRVFYVQPFQMYLIIATAFFFLNSYKPLITIDPNTFEVKGGVGPYRVTLNKTEEVKNAHHNGQLPPEIIKEQFDKKVKNYLPAFMFGAIILFALFLKLLYLPSKRSYVEHAIFALHFYSFFFIFFSLQRLLAPLSPLILGILGLIIVPGYLLLALRNVYQDSWPMAIIKMLPLYTGFIAILSIWISSVGALALSHIKM